jgi:hypothetical protein
VPEKGLSGGGKKDGHARQKVAISRGIVTNGMVTMGFSAAPEVVPIGLLQLCRRAEVDGTCAFRPLAFAFFEAGKSDWAVPRSLYFCASHLTHAINSSDGRAAIPPG